jgi:ferredoxin/flavodoxin---NADP+ reductase
MNVGTYDLVVIGAGPTGLSIASHAQRRGLSNVIILEAGERAIPVDAVGRYGLAVRYQFGVERIENQGDAVVVESGTESLRASLVVVVSSSAGAPPPFPWAATLEGRVHTALGAFEPTDKDVLVAGAGDDVVAAAELLLDAGARVVVAFAGSHADLSRVARESLAELEHARRLTVLWHSAPSAVEDIDGYPMAFFDDRRTPDLQFDHVVAIYPHDTAVAAADGRLFTVDSIAPASNPLGAASSWDTITSSFIDELPPPKPGWPRPSTTHEVEQLRVEHYNATITHFDFSHEDLWVIRVRPDQRDTVHRPGQYATLGLGYWEPRVDDADEGLSEAQRSKMIRRSYSISSQIFDQYGYLVDAGEEREIEFYIVHVRPTEDRIPALTPRLAGKRVCDRIYLGPKIAGRYTRDPVTDPEADVVLLATGTGEAPHNAMITELLRKGHRGRIVSLVTVRQLRDLGYVEHHRTLERYHPNYTYVTLPTREPSVPKRYIQDVVRDGELEAMLAHGLDPRRTHVFLCGNPAMIGLPEWSGHTPTFPEVEGVVEILHKRGFTIDHRGVIGNVHYEEYW